MNLFRFFILIFCLSSLSKGYGQSTPMTGGGTSGGGHFKGISAKTVFDVVHASIMEIGTDLYPKATISELAFASDKVAIIMTDEGIPTKNGDYTQSSDGFSIKCDDEYTMYLNSKSWKNTEDPMLLEELVHHELMVLLGLEKTGVYTYTEKFKKIRKEYWRLIQTKNNFCSVQVFEKQLGARAGSPGKLVGSSSASISFSGAKGDMGILSTKQGNTAIIWRGVIDNLGYFKMQIEEAQISPKTKMVDLSRTTLLEPMQMYSDPYSGLSLQSRPVTMGENYWVIVNCNRF